MNRTEFRVLFDRVIEEVIENTKSRIECVISSNIVVELHGAGHIGDMVSIDEAFDSIYIDDETYWRVIDVVVKKIELDNTVIFIRISGHQPVSFDKTWNNPDGYGPFKPC